jgi:cell pole-organizing protein PopZ
MSFLLGEDIEYRPDPKAYHRGQEEMAAKGQAIIDRLDDRIEAQEARIAELEARLKRTAMERGMMTSVALALAEQLAGNPTAQPLLDRARARVIDDVRSKANIKGTRQDFAAIFAKNLTFSDWKDETRRLVEWLGIDSESAGQLPRELPNHDNNEPLWWM